MKNGDQRDVNMVLIYLKNHVLCKYARVGGISIIKIEIWNMLMQT